MSAKSDIGASLSFRICLMIMLATHGLMFCQISGTVNDANKEPLAFVNIAILDKQKASIINGTSTDENGNFSLDPGNSKYVVVSFSMIGFKTHNVEIDISNYIEGNTLNIVLLEESVNLKGVTVESYRKLIKRDSEKVVFDTKSFVDKAGDAFSVLEITPGVTINRSTSTMLVNGKSDISVLLNGRFLGNSTEALFQILSGISSVEIESIELIDNPGASRDAQGGTIINIVTKSRASSAWNLNVDGGTGYGEGTKYFGSINYFKTLGRFSFSTGYSFNLNNTYEIWSFERNQEESSLLVESLRDPKVKIHNFNVNIFYSLDSISELGFQARIFNRNWDMLAKNKTRLLEGENIEEILSIDEEQDSWNNGIYGLYFTRTFSNDVDLRAEFDYLDYKNDNRHLYENNLSSESEFISITKETPFEIYVGKISVSSDKSKLKYKYGIKYTGTNFSNSLFNSNLTNPNLSFTEKSEIKENISAAWIEGDIKLGQKSINLGLRGENTNISIKDIINGEVLRDNTFFDLFPSGKIDFDLKNNKHISLGYSRRINRPSYSSLAPFIVFLGPNTVFNGNTLLSPAYTNLYTMIYNTKKYNFTLQYKDESNSIIGYQPILNQDNNILEIKPLNFEESKQVLLTCSSQYNIASKISLQLNSSFFWESVSDGILYNTDMYKDNYAAILNGSLTFNLKHDVKIQIVGTLQSRILAGFNTTESPGYLNLSMEKRLGNFRVFASIDDLFSTNNWQIDGIYPSLNLELFRNYNWENRIFKFGVSYNIKKLNQKERGFGGSKEEQERVW